MSAKLVSTRSSFSSAPPLPPEIWLSILRAAIDLPNDFDLQLFRLEKPKGYAERTLRERLVTARKIVLVSKRWRILAIPLFYETVWISKESHLETLVSLLRKKSTPYNKTYPTAATSRLSFYHDKEPPLADYIQRLVFTMTTSLMPDRHPIISLTSLCSSNLTNLHIISTINFDAEPSPNDNLSLQFVRDLPWENLRILSMHRLLPEPISPTSPNWLKMIIGRMKAMKILRCDYVPWEMVQAFKCTSIESLSIHITPTLPKIAASSSYSNIPIKELIVRNIDALPGIEIPSTEMPSILTRVAITLEKEFAFPGIFRSLRSWLPDSVTRVDIWFPAWYWICGISALPMELPAGLTHLGLYARRVQTSDEFYEYLLELCQMLAGDGGTGGLRTVQLLSQQTYIDLKSRHALILKRIVDALHQGNIQLVDSNGDLIEAQGTFGS